MSELEAELAAALKARSALVRPDPDAWEKHRVAAAIQPVSSSRDWISRRRVLPLVVAAAVVLVAAVGTSIVVSNNHGAPAIAPVPVASVTAKPPTTPSPAHGTSQSAIPAPSRTSMTVTVPALTCTGDVLGQAQMTPVGVTGFLARLQLRRAAGDVLLCAGITGRAGGTVQTSTGGTVNGGGPLDLAGSSTWDQGSPVFIWGAVDTRVSGVRVTGTAGKAGQLQFAALASGRRAFLAVLPANTKTATLTAVGADGRTVTTRRLTTTFGEPDTLPTTAPVAPTTSSPATSNPPTASSPSMVIASTTTVPTSPGASTTSPPAAPVAGCDGPGTGLGIVDLGVGSGTVSLNYLQNKTLCFSNGGPLTAAHRVPGVMPYAAGTTLVSGQGVWGAVTPNVAKVVLTDDKSPKGRTAQLLPLGSDLKVFVEETSGTVHLRALNATGTVLYTKTFN